MDKETTELDEALEGLQEPQATEADDVSEPESPETPPEESDEATDEEISSLFEVSEEKRKQDRDRVFESTVNKAVEGMLEAEDDETREELIGRLPKKFQSEALDRYNKYFEEEKSTPDIDILLNRRDFTNEIKNLVSSVPTASRAKLIAAAKQVATDLPNLNDLGKKGATRLYNLAMAEAGIKPAERQNTIKPRSSQPSQVKAGDDWEGMDEEDFYKFVQSNMK